MKVQSKSLRTDHLVALNSQQSAKINKHEIALSTWRTVRYLTDSNTTSTLDQLEIPTTWPQPFPPIENIHSLPDPKLATDWQSITSVEAIEYYLQLRNRLHFGQAKVTPFAQPDFQESIPWNAESTTVEDILSGTYIPPETVPDLCQHVLRTTCVKKNASDIISPFITYESFQGKIRKWRESTTTSPSGRHLGRYKALFAKSTYESQEEAEAFSYKQTAIAKVIVVIMNFCIRTGHVLHRWRVVVNTMIFKDPGNFKIHRLRVLHIYENISGEMARTTPCRRLPWNFQYESTRCSFWLRGGITRLVRRDVD